MTIGIGGGIGGGLRLGLIYGAMLMIVFGIVVGVPVGLVGGVIRWLSAPVDEHSPARNRLSPSTLRTDRTVSIAAVLGIGAAAAAGIALLTGPLSKVAATIDRLSSFTIVPADGILFGFSIGLIVACFCTAWPAYLLTHIWLTLLRRAPVRLARFFEDLHRAEILRREGSYVLFRHLEYQAYLSSHGEEFVTAFESQQDGWAELASCQHPGNRQATDPPAEGHPPQPTPEPASTKPLHGPGRRSLCLRLPERPSTPKTSMRIRAQTSGAIPPVPAVTDEAIAVAARVDGCAVPLAVARALRDAHTDWPTTGRPADSTVWAHLCASPRGSDRMTTGKIVLPSAAPAAQARRTEPAEAGAHHGQGLPQRFRPAGVTIQLSRVATRLVAPVKSLTCSFTPCLPRLQAVLEGPTNLRGDRLSQYQRLVSRSRRKPAKITFPGFLGGLRRPS